MFDACFNKQISIHGDGSQRRSFLSMRNASESFSNLLTHPLTAGTYNLVDRVLAINEIADTIKTVLPETEMLFINQHMRLRELMVMPDERLKVLSQLKEMTFLRNNFV